MTDAVARIFYRFVGGNQALPLTLGLRNIYILPTGYGVLYLTVVGAMLIGSINYNNNLGFLLTFLLGSLALAAMLHTYGMLYGLTLVSASTVPVFAGEAAAVTIVLGRVDRPRTGIRWYFRPELSTDTDLAPSAVHRIAVHVPTTRRGTVAPGWLRIACDYPLGLFKAWTRIDPGMRCLVYPKPLMAALPAASQPAANGVGTATGETGADDFRELSAYQPGDPPGRIHWQAFSRGRGLHTKRFGGEAGEELLLDMARIPGDDDERKLSVLCHHVLRAHRGRQPYGLRMPGLILPVGSGRTHRERCLRALALFGTVPP